MSLLIVFHKHLKYFFSFSSDRQRGKRCLYTFRLRPLWYIFNVFLGVSDGKHTLHPRFVEVIFIFHRWQQWKHIFHIAPQCHFGVPLHIIVLRFLIFHRCQRGKTLFIQLRLRQPFYINNAFPRCQRWKHTLHPRRVEVFVIFHR